MFKRVSGTRDILPGEVEVWQQLEAQSRSIFSCHNYREIRPPIIEEEALFNRCLGESAEIVQKQMFIIKREHDVYALRPEGTAAIVRAYLENSLDKQQGFVKFFYMGPMFRAERPQKARLRQFHHIGCEAIGSYAPEMDIEVIALADTLLKAYGIKGYRIVINSLGCSEDKKAFNLSLKEKLKDKLNLLCEDCQQRYQRNVLRILDCKNPDCKNIVADYGFNNDHLCADCQDHFKQVKQGLDLVGINYEVSSSLVRGLDYYNRSVFEIKHEGLGPQQDALGAGGRYDGLVKQLGGPDSGAVGFAFGVERLLLALGDNPLNIPGIKVFLITLGDQARKSGVKLLACLRAAGIACDTDYQNRSLKAAMRKANDMKADFVAILGDDELKENVVMLKDMHKSTQEKVAISSLIEKLS